MTILVDDQMLPFGRAVLRHTQGTAQLFYGPPAERCRVLRHRGSRLEGNSEKAAHRPTIALDAMRFRHVKELQHQSWKGTLNLSNWQRLPALFRTEGSIAFDNL